MNIFEIFEHVRSKEAAIEFLRQRGILRSVALVCPNCGENMSENRRASRGDGLFTHAIDGMQAHKDAEHVELCGMDHFWRTKSLSPRNSLCLLTCGHMGFQTLLRNPCAILATRQSRNGTNISVIWPYWYTTYT